jgi:hypothetical protein
MIKHADSLDAPAAVPMWTVVSGRVEISSFYPVGRAR